MILVGGLVAVLAVGGAIFGFVKMRNSGSSNSAQHQPQQSAPAAAQPAPVTTAGNTPVQPAPAAVQPVSTPAPANKPDRAEGKKSESDSRRNEARNEQPSKPTTVELQNGGSKLSAAAASQPQPQDVAPSLSVAGGSSDLGSLVHPAATPKLAPAVSQSNLVNASLVRTVPAVYPEIAKARRLSGAVTLKFTITKEGKVANPQFISGPVIFRDAAFDAVKQWTFKPAMLNGQPVDQENQVTMNFKP
jgi:protein TonB